MLKHEFEALYGKEVGENEFEVINGLYMLNDDETKQDFVIRYKKMSKDDLMSAFIALNQRSKEYSNKQTARARELERDEEELRKDYTELEKKHREFVEMIASYAHQHDAELICEVCAEDLGTLAYYKALLAAGCEPTKADLEMFVRVMEGQEGVKHSGK